MLGESVSVLLASAAQHLQLFHRTSNKKILFWVYCRMRNYTCIVATANCISIAAVWRIGRIRSLPTSGISKAFLPGRRVFATAAAHNRFIPCLERNFSAAQKLFSDGIYFKRRSGVFPGGGGVNIQNPANGKLFWNGAGNAIFFVRRRLVLNSLEQRRGGGAASSLPAHAQANNVTACVGRHRG